MALTDLELKAISQIAYYELKPFENDPDRRITVWEALKDSERETLKGYGIEESQLKEWEIVGVYNDNGDSGFCACIVETSPGQAAVAFRGSEDLDELGDVKEDWVGADLGLLNSTLTEQQAEAHEFLKKYTTSPNAVLNEYDSLIMAGHSLGGNLAEYSTIFSDLYGLDDNIIQCASLDGPGHSQEFINLYRERIEKMSGVMYHPRWSWVGGLLQDLPGVNYKYIDVENSDRAKKDYNFGTRHSLVYIKQDKDNPNNFADGKQDPFAAITEHITEGIDHLPTPIGNAVVTIIGSAWIGFMWAKENFLNDDKSISATGWGIIAGAVGLIAVFGLKTVAMTVIAVLVAVLVVIVVAAVAELLYDLVMAVVDTICEAVAKAYNWAKEVYQQFKEAVKSFINKAKSWLKNNFNNGYQYANSHPQINVDTYKLRDYAQRIQKVNGRISVLDGRIDSLYWNVGLLDLWNLTQADILIGYSRRLLKAETYLSNTAAYFEAVEADLIGNI